MEGGNAGGKLLFLKTLFLAHESVPLGKTFKKEKRKIELGSIEHWEQFVKYKYEKYLRIYLSTGKQTMILQNKQQQKTSTKR